MQTRRRDHALESAAFRYRERGFEMLPSWGHHSARWHEAQLALLTRGVDMPTALEETTSYHGLEALWSVVAPLDWPELIREGVVTPSNAGMSRFGPYLRTGAAGDLCPSTARDRSVRDRRVAAARLEDLFWHEPIAAMDEQWMCGRAQLALQELSPTTRQKTLRWLRRWVLAATEAIRARTDASERWRWSLPALTVGDAPCSPREVERLLDAADPRLHLLIEMAVSARLLPCQMAHLQVEVDDADRCSVRVPGRRVRGGRGEAVLLELPGWTLRRHGRSVLAVPLDTREVLAAQARLRRLAGRLDVDASTFADLRRGGQGVAYASGGCRALIRGVVGSHRRQLAAIVAAEQGALVRRWQVPSRPPVEPMVVPSSAPPRCPFDIAELDWREGES